jgi:Carbohydrate binding domain
VNIVQNSDLTDDLNKWYPLGKCNMAVANGSPRIVPPMAKESLGFQEPLSSKYILVTNRTQSWMGPAQTITDKINLHVTYQVSGWVSVRSAKKGPQIINVAIGMDTQWVNGGQIQVSDERWYEVGGSFRVEQQPSKVMVYVQGPEAGVDLMVAGLQIFPVDRKERFKHLKNMTDKVYTCRFYLFQVTKIIRP